MGSTSECSGPYEFIVIKSNVSVSCSLLHVHVQMLKLY